eukprot:TRINITY_DN27690_c0_g1_i1.p3 TRINITY_DN27690_c0_g1~~TRINITY_DN27690_c0_g1_i1.p3  ORF type:complete len:154 (-),score=41.09 TRINITY_DN27690_c0_g1_i1:55-516(-)
MLAGGFCAVWHPQAQVATLATRSPLRRVPPEQRPRARTDYPLAAFWGWTPRHTRRAYAYSAIGLAALLPLSATLAAARGRAPRVVDHAVGVVAPLHLFIGCSKITQDYVFHPRLKVATLAALSGFSAATALAALHCNLRCGGIGNTLLMFWRI